MNNRVVTQSNGNVTGNNNMVKGDNNWITGNNCAVIGDHNSVTGNNCTIIGNNNRIIGNNCNIEGNNNTNRGNGGTVRGNKNQIIGKPKSVSGICNSVNGESAGMVNSGVSNSSNNAGDTFEGVSVGSHVRTDICQNIIVGNRNVRKASRHTEDSDSPSSPSSSDSPDAPDSPNVSGNASISGNNFQGVNVFYSGPGVVRYSREPWRYNTSVPSNAEPIDRTRLVSGDNIAIGRTGPNKPRSLADALKDIKDTETKDEDKKCVICLTNERVIAFQCGHRKTCASCSLELVQTEKPCPMCRVEISSILKIFD